jgi:hypothetical protein
MSALLPTPFCELPAWDDFDGWFGQLTTSQKWLAKYPLVDVQWSPEFALHDGYMCSFGFSFLAESITSFLLMVISLGCFIRLQTSFPHSHHARKVLFVLLVVVGVIRGVYNAVASRKIMQVSMYIDTIDMIPWFFKTNIPVNAVCDLLVAYIDFMLTFFWLDIMYHKFVRSRLGVALQISLFLASSVALACTLGLDYDEVITRREFNGGNIYHRSLAFLVFLFIISGVMHIAVVGLLVWSMFRMTGDITLFMDRKMRLNILIVATIGFVSAICLLLRAGVLIGRLSWNEFYVTGRISLDNPTFTTIYYILMMNLPCIVVALAFAILTHKLIVDEGRAREDNDGTRDSLIITSPGGVVGTASGPYGGLDRGSVARVGPRSPLVVGAQQYRKQQSMRNFRQTPVSATSEAAPSSATSLPAFPREQPNSEKP